MTFSQLDLTAEIINALPVNITQPSDIQRSAIPIILSGQDLVALAQTGSGKTLAFGLPVLQHVVRDIEKPQVLIVVPTRELAVQVGQSLFDIAKLLAINVATLCGGVSQAQQVRQIDSGAHIIVATPGRLLDLIQQRLLCLDTVSHWVLDEVDRLVDMGFWPAIESIATHVPKKRQTLLFSATLVDKLNTLALTLMNQPVRVEAHRANSVVATVNEQLYLVNKGSKAKVLQWILTQHQSSQVLVFISARDSVDAFAKKMKKVGVDVAALHGEKDHAQRVQTLSDFKDKKLRVLIATDVLARGIDIEALPLVINLDLPASAPTYIHRVGRTARAGSDGLAISLVCHGEQQALDAIRELTQRELQLTMLENFPVTDKPASGERKRPPRDKQANRRTAKKRGKSTFKGRD